MESYISMYNQENPTCKNSSCNNKIFNKTRLGKWSLHCSSTCRYSSPRGGKQYVERPPICAINECDNLVSWHSDKRTWNKYCGIKCGKIGRSRNVSVTKQEQNSQIIKEDVKILCKCAIDDCCNIAILRKKKGVTRAYCSDRCRNIGRVNNQNITFKEKYGVSRPSQNNEIFQKSEKNAKKLRDYIFQSGKVVKVRGYEPLALRKLEDLGHNESSLVIDIKQMPKIWYNFENKSRRYYPDIFIPSENKIIEVKSSYTYNKYLQKNFSKKDRVLEMGIKFEFWIFDEKGNLLDIPDDK